MKLLIRPIRCLGPVLAPLFECDKQGIEELDRVLFLLLFDLSEDVLSPFVFLLEAIAAFVLCQDS